MMAMAARPPMTPPAIGPALGPLPPPLPLPLLVEGVSFGAQKDVGHCVQSSGTVN